MSSNSLRTEIKIQNSDWNIGLKDSIITIGSCFSDSIGERLKKYKFNTLVNPFGTVYNPISIFRLLQDQPIDPDRVVENQGLFLHYDFHSSFRKDNKEDLLKSLDEIKVSTIDKLRKADCLVITLGTAWVYELASTGEIVANCHKVPQKGFSKRLLGLKEIIKAFDGLVESLRPLNPDLKILLTVSPVRHIKDGIEENQLSKSMLRVICDFAVSSYDHVAYFPSYEIMMDDLRDYRFYKDDLIHPTEFAEEYIWKKFMETYFDSETLEFVKEWQSILAAMEHRPFNPGSPDHRLFCQSQIEKLDALSEVVDVREEKEFFNQK